MPPAQILRLREKLGATQAEFCRLTGVKPGTLKNWEQGRRQPTGPALVLLRLLQKHGRTILDLTPQKP